MDFPQVKSNEFYQIMKKMKTTSSAYFQFCTINIEHLSKIGFQKTKITEELLDI